MCIIQKEWNTTEEMLLVTHIGESLYDMPVSYKKGDQNWNNQKHIAGHQQRILHPAIDAGDFDTFVSQYIRRFFVIPS